MTARDTRAVRGMIRRSLRGEKVELLGDWSGVCAILEELGTRVEGPGDVRYEGAVDGVPWTVVVRPIQRRGPGGVQPGSGRPRGTELKAVTMRFAPDELAMLEQLRAPTPDRSRKLSQREAVVVGLRAALGQAEKGT